MGDLRENVRQIRQLRSLPQQALADELGIDVSAISNFEKGKRDFRIGSLSIIAAVLGVEVLDLFTWPRHYADSGFRLDITKDRVGLEREDMDM